MHCPEDYTVGALDYGLEAEWSNWRKSLPGHDGTRLTGDAPGILEPGGLPDGWNVRKHWPGGPGTVVCLVNRTGGGWMLTQQIDGHERTTGLHICEYTFADLRAEVARYVATAVPGPPLERWKKIEEMVDDFLVTLYDPTDPVEAAEQVLVGLGARPSRIPAALS